MGETQSPILPYPRSAEYGWAGKTQIPISISENDAKIGRTGTPIVPLAGKGTDFELQVVADVLGLGSLHYGYTPPGEAEITTLDAMQRAQDRYTDTLVSWLPREAKRVLDVGCGMGDVARAIAARGHQVTAISPDSHHGQFFQRAVPNVTFVRSRFETFRSERRFDLVLMCESNNYFDPVVGLDRARDLLRPGGWLLISGIFKKRDVESINTDLSREAEYREMAAAHSFTLRRRQDITREVGPTLDFARRTMERFAIPTARIMAQFLVDSSPVARSAAWLLRLRPMVMVDRVANFYAKRLDSVFFAWHQSYLRLLWQFTPGQGS